MRSLPAEWETQSGVMLTWPDTASDWHDHLTAVEQTYGQLAQHISRQEKLLICCRNAAHQQHIEKLLQHIKLDAQQQHRIIFSHVAANDSWSRDHGPITVLEDQQPLLLNFSFNGWGNKYPAELDNQITGHLHANGIFNQTPLISLPYVLEGGAIDCDGQGTLLTTTQCLLTTTRNPRLSQQDVEKLLCLELGVHRILWMTEGMLVGDDTDSHVDMLARFCSTDIIAYTSCDDKHDEHYQPLSRMREELATFRTPDNRPYTLVDLPIPAAKFAHNGQRLPASYANFLIINNAVLVPTYNDPADAIALQRLQECFKHRTIIGIDCLPLIQQYGSLHCVTMQLPLGVL